MNDLQGSLVAVLGSLHLDVMVDTPRLPVLGETLPGGPWAFKCGGKGGNQAIEAARHGASVAMIGCVGRDEFGARLLANLAAGGVDVAAVRQSDSAGSGMSVALSFPGGDYSAVIVSGCNQEIGAEDIAAPVLQTARPLLLLQNEVPAMANALAAAQVRRQGGTVILNAAPAMPVIPALAACIDILVVNAVEAEMLGAVRVFDRASAAAAAAQLAQRFPTVIVTAGGDGLAVQGGAAAFQLPAHRVAVVSTHGAGDAFLGALAARLAAGGDLASAIVYANAAAAILVSTPEDQRAALTPAATLALIRAAG